MKKLLCGHTSPETAYIIEDYPYGRTLRCKMRCWIETATKGSKNGEQRFVTQTNNPKKPGLVWNKPKAGNYSHVVVMYLNSENNHVETESLWSYGDGPEQFFIFKHDFYSQMDTEQQRVFNEAETLAKAVNAGSWKDFDKTLQEIHVCRTTEGYTALNDDLLYLYLLNRNANPEIGLLCCKFARKHPCVCSASRICPVHDVACIGTHD